MNRTALIELKEKVEAETPKISSDFEAAFPDRHEHWDEDPAAHAVSAYLGSLDAAKVLHEAVLPGWSWLVRAPNDMDPFINHCNSGDFLANVWRADDDPNEGDDHYSEWSQIPARAWLLAILSALIAMETEEPKEGY